MSGRTPEGTVDTTTSHCPYCALNCGIGLATNEAGRLVGQVRWKGSPLTGGAVCSKGSTAWEQVHHDDRLTMPLVRRNGVLVETSWEEALDLAAEGFMRIRREHGADANAMLSGGSLTNEKAYLVGKFARLALGTRHVDYNGRFCMVSAGSANMAAFGRDRAMTPLSEVATADVIVVVGANLSDAYPVMLPAALNKARKRGARVVAIDPRFGRWVQDEDMQIAIRPATDGVLFTGLLAEIDRQGLLDLDYVATRTKGFRPTIEAARAWSPESVEAVTDVSADTVRELAHLIATAPKCLILHARGPEQQTMGTNNVLAMINVALACGLPGRPGSGINMLTGQRNGQGGREWGQRCNQLPAGRSIANDEHREVVAKRWGVEASDLPGVGSTYTEILQMAGRGEIKGLLSISNNMSISAPDLDRVDEQMDSLEHVVIIDPFLSEATRHADVVLPGTTFAEEEGTITTIEGRIVRCDQAVAPTPLRSDIDIFRNLATRLGHRHQFDFVLGREVFEEMREVSAGGPNDYAGITWDRAREGIFWPCPDESHPGTPQLYTERFAHPDGLAVFHPVELATPPVVVDDEYPFVLTTGRHLAQYLSGNQTKRIPAQQRLAPGPYVEIHPDTAGRLGLDEGDRAVLTSRQGWSTVPWKPNLRLRPDTLFMPYHWRECNVLVSSDLDPTSKIPGFKYTPISVTPLANAHLDDDAATNSSTGNEANTTAFETVRTVHS
ncbi:molybdopterin oxidoreductase family protein [Ilumatobacter nonamiensis]|uniref:molybdopterin oxidoreductase family protein n=1 Tax=Ilumatobacter nonamiensis TaxID=467093 RepID=UPI0003489DDE|nr:molybdopterin-dependent oxidoreductase [Ilumatobacter nonamiensis]